MALSMNSVGIPGGFFFGAMPDFRENRGFGVVSGDLEAAKRTLFSEDGGLKVRFSLATIAFDRESAQMLSNTVIAREKRTFKPLSSLFSAFSNLKVI